MEDQTSAQTARLPRSLRERVGLGFLLAGGIWAAQVFIKHTQAPDADAESKTSAS